MRFWLARLAGVTANQMLMVAVAWHMYDITSSAWDLGLVGLFQFVPGEGAKPCTVGYFFLFNGSFMTSADLLRIATFFGPTRNLYYCKFEMMPATLRRETGEKIEFEGGVANHATARQMMRDFLTHAFPEAKKHLP